MISAGKEEPTQLVCSGFDAEKGVARSTVRTIGAKRTFGRIGTVHDSLTKDNRYNLWLDGEYPHKADFVFRYLLDHAGAFEVRAPVDADKVQLTVPWQPWWAEKPGGKRVFLLDPRKGFLLIRGDSRWDDPETKGWRRETLLVEDSRLVADVWMPLRLKEIIAASTGRGRMSVFDVKISRIEHGVVTPADLVVPFTEGMEITDAIKKVTYVADAQGNPAGPVKPPKPAGPAGPATAQEGSATWWRYAIALVTSGLLVALFAWLFLRRRSRSAG